MKRRLRDPDSIDALCRRVRAQLRQRPEKAPDNPKRIGELRAQVDNLADAIASGALRASPTLAAKLAAAEDELAKLESVQAMRAAGPSNVERILADLRTRAVRSVDQLERTLAAGDVPKAREVIRSNVGTVTVEADTAEIRLFSDLGAVAAAVARNAGGLRTRNFGSGGRI